MKKQKVSKLLSEDKKQDFGGFANKLATNQDNIIQSEFFGIERQDNKQAISLDLQLESGEKIGIPYTHLGIARFKSSAKILIKFMGGKIEIEGRNLDLLYDYYLQHRVTFIKENIGDLDEVPENALFIEKITVEELQTW